MCGSVVEDVVDVVDQGLVSLDKAVAPIGWSTVGTLALAPFTGGASLALDAGAVAAADATAAGLGFSSAAEAIAAGATTAEALGLPAAATVADLAAVEGTASAGWAGLGVEPGIAGGVPYGTDLASQAAPYAGDAQYAAQDVMQQARNVNAAAGSPESIFTGAKGTTLGDVLGYAKTGAEVVGGLAKMAGGAKGLSAGRQVAPGQADPYAQYRSGNAALLQNLINNPSTVTTTPGYQFRLKQGLDAMAARQAAQGRLVSGGALLESQAFGQDLAQQQYQQQVDTLARLSGAYQSPATGASAMQGVAFGNAGAGNYAYNALGGGIGQVATGLLNLYENYNKPSPNPTV